MSVWESKKKEGGERSVLSGPRDAGTPPAVAGPADPGCGSVKAPPTPSSPSTARKEWRGRQAGPTLVSKRQGHRGTRLSRPPSHQSSRSPFHGQRGCPAPSHGVGSWVWLTDGGGSVCPFWSEVFKRTFLSVPAELTVLQVPGLGGAGPGPDSLWGGTPLAAQSPGGSF